jgi:hypothetical protein
MTEAQRAKVRVLLCGTIPDPRPTVDSRLKLLDEALKDLEMGEGNMFLSLRGSLLDAQGAVRKDIFKPRGDIHLNSAGTQIVSLRIRKMLEIMLPNLVPVQAPVSAPVSAQVQTPPAPVQTPTPAKVQRPRVQAPVPDPAPVVVNTPPVVGAPLVAVVNAPDVAQVQAVVNTPAVVVQDQVETPMETDEDELLAKLFFKKYGRALPVETEKEKEKESEVDQIKFVIDLTDESDEMEVATPVVVVKTEPIEITNANVANVASVNNFAKAKSVYNESGIRVSRRLELIELAKARKAINEFGKSLRKKDIIPEKEAPLAAENVIAIDDTDMAEDVSVNEANSVNPVGPVNVVESLTTAEAIEMAEAAIAESDAAIAANQKEIDKFFN